MGFGISLGTFWKWCLGQDLFLLAVNEMLAWPREHPLWGGRSPCIALAQPSPLCPVLSCPFPPCRSHGTK